LKINGYDFSSEAANDNEDRKKKKENCEGEQRNYCESLHRSHKLLFVMLHFTVAK